MRRMLVWSLAAMPALGLMGLAYGCTGGDTCEDRETCVVATDGGAEGTVAPPPSDAMAEGSGDSRLDEPAMCDPTAAPKDNPCVLDDAYGIFVGPMSLTDAQAASGDANDLTTLADGTMARPYLTIGQALANLGAKTRIYICNGIYAEQVRIASAVSLYGGLSCLPGPAALAWQYVGGTAEVISPSPAYALSIVGPTPFGCSGHPGNPRTAQAARRNFKRQCRTFGRVPLACIE
jgi:hypothetical protein